MFIAKLFGAILSFAEKSQVRGVAILGEAIPHTMAKGIAPNSHFIQLLDDDFSCFLRNTVVILECFIDFNDKAA